MCESGLGMSDEEESSRRVSKFIKVPQWLESAKTGAPALVLTVARLASSSASCTHQQTCVYKIIRNNPYLLCIARCLHTIGLVMPWSDIELPVSIPLALKYRCDHQRPRIVMNWMHTTIQGCIGCLSISVYSVCWS